MGKPKQKTVTSTPSPKVSRIKDAESILKKTDNAKKNGSHLRKSASCSSISDFEDAVTTKKTVKLNVPKDEKAPAPLESKLLKVHEMKLNISAADSMKQAEYWKKAGWPVKFLVTDPKSAKLFEENCIFQHMKMYGHKWRWDKKGLHIPVEPSEQIERIYASEQDDEAILQKLSQIRLEYRPWAEIKNDIKYVENHGWLVPYGAFYGPYGFSYTTISSRHLWKWKKLLPAFHYNLNLNSPLEKPTLDPSKQRPSYCYVDIMSCSWQHSGLPGFGFFGRPHGHVSIEFGDDLGTLWSVGQYPDPFRDGSRMSHVYGTVGAVLMTPDPYFPADGEKSVHRYHIGKGEKGRKNIKKLISLVENIQQVGIVHNAVASNCGDFAEYIERYINTNMKDDAFLVNLADESVFIPLRTKQPRKSKSKIKYLTAKFYHYFILWIVNLLMTILYWLPLGTKLGRGKGVDIYVEEKEEEHDEEINEERVGQEEEEEEEEDDEGQDSFEEFDELGDDEVHLNEKQEKSKDNSSSTSTGGMKRSHSERVLYYKNYGALRRRNYRFINPTWPRKLRLKQTYSNRLKNYSSLFTCNAS